MKRVLNLLLIMVLVFGLTGCVKYHVSMDVDSDKSVTLEIIHGINVSMLEDIGGTSEDELEDDYVSDDDYWSVSEDDGYISDDEYQIEEDTSLGVDYETYREFEEKGFTIIEFSEKTEDGTIGGVKLTKTYPNIDEISSDKEIVVDLYERFNADNIVNFDDSKYFTKNGNKYTAKFTFDLSAEEETDLSIYASNFDLQYKIKLPEAAISNNATSVSEDGKELIWDLEYGKTNPTNFEFALGSNINTTIIFVGSILFFVTSCSVLVFVIYKSKKKKIVPQTIQ